MQQLSLTMVIGVPGSGKSTWAREFCKKNPDILYLSTDEIRKKIGSGEEDQSVNNEVFRVMKNKTEDALKNNSSVLLDATFIKRSWRKDFTEIGRRYSARLIAHVFKVGKEVLIKRIQKRASLGGLNVPIEVIDKYIKMFEEPLPGEFDIIINH